MGEQPEGEKNISERFDIIMGETKGVIKQAYQSSGAPTIGDSVKSALEKALSQRDNVVMVRLNDEALAKVDELKDSGVVASRSEAVAFLVSEGIAARSELFERMEGKMEELRRVKQELSDLLRGVPAEPDTDEPDKGKDAEG